MTDRTGEATFSDRVSLHFKAAGKDAAFDELLVGLTEFLARKKSFGVLPGWVKNAVIEQYIRETQYAEPSAELTFGTKPSTTRGVDTALASDQIDQPEPIMGSEPPPPIPSGTRRVSELKGANVVAGKAAEAEADITKPASQPMPMGLKRLMG